MLCYGTVKSCTQLSFTLLYGKGRKYPDVYDKFLSFLPRLLTQQCVASIPEEYGRWPTLEKRAIGLFLGRILPQMIKPLIYGQKTGTLKINTYIPTYIKLLHTYRVCFTIVGAKPIKLSSVDFKAVLPLYKYMYIYRCVSLKHLQSFLFPLHVCSGIFLFI